MPYEEQLVAGAAQFTGLAGAGLFTFGESALFPQLAYGIIIHSVFVNCDGAAPLIQIFAGFNGTPAGELRLLGAGTANSVGINCEFIQPRTDLNVAMELLILTTGKTAAGRAELHWSMGRIIR